MRCLLAFLLIAAAATAQSVDRHGDPLPEGAIARLGTERLRNGTIVSDAAFAPDGKTAYVAEYYAGVRAWDLESGRVVRRMYRDEYLCHRVALSPDGKTLAVALGDLTIRLCDAATGVELGALPRQDNRLNDLRFSPDGKTLATTIGGSEVRLYDVAARTASGVVRFPDSVGRVSFSPDGTRLVGGSGKGAVVMNIALNREVRRHLNDPGGTHSIHAEASPVDGTLAAWGYDDGSIRLFDADGKELRRIERDGPKRKAGTWGWAYDMEVAWSPDGKTIAAVRDTGRLDVWDAATGKTVRTLSHDAHIKPSHLSFSPDGRRLMATGGGNWGGDNIVRVWDTATWTMLHDLTGHGAAIGAVAFAPDGRTVATAGNEGVVHLWEPRTGKHVRRLEATRGRNPELLFAPDGGRLVWNSSYRGDGTLRVWDPATGRETLRIERPTGQSSWTTVSPDARVAWSADTQARVTRKYDLGTGKVVGEMTGEDAYTNTPYLMSPRGDAMIGGYSQLRSVAGGKELRQLGHPSRSVSEFTSDGRFLVVGVPHRGDGLDLRSDPPAEEVLILDPRTGRERRSLTTFPGRLPSIDAVAVSRDGRTIVTAWGEGYTSQETIVTLWETETGHERARFCGHVGRSTSVAFSPDGRLVVTGGADTTALVWDVSRPPMKNPLGCATPSKVDVAAKARSLAADDGVTAFTAVWALVDRPKEAVAALAAQADLFERASDETVKGWIASLDSPRFAEREKASRGLADAADHAEPLMREALTASPSAETRTRIESILKSRQSGFSAVEMRKVRAMEVLEHIARETPSERAAAVKLLERMAAVSPGSRLSDEAAATLKRLN